MATIAFIQHSSFDLHGLMYIAGLLKHHGHKTQLFIEPAERNLLDLLKKLSPDFVGFPITSEERLWALEWASTVKKTLQATTIVGGIDPTICPDIIEHPSVDIVCCGEGEFPLLELLDTFDQAREISTDIENLWFKKNGTVIKNPVRPLIEDLDVLPMVDRGIYYDRYRFIRNYPTKRFMIGRGCPFDCSYCCNRALKKMYQGKGKYVRRHSVDRILNEIKQVKEQYGVRTIDFIDDDFISDKPWLRSFLERYREEIKVPFSCLVRIDLVDEETAALLTDAGCTTVSFGIESGNEDLRNSILKKRLSDASITRGAALLKQHGLKLNTYNMLNIPGETLADGFQTVRLNVKIATDSPWCSIFQPFPGTEFWNTLADRCSPDDDRNLTTQLNFYSSSLIQQKDSIPLANLAKLFYYAVKFPSLHSVIKRLVRFRPNKIFDLLFLIAFAYRHATMNNMSLWEELKFNLRHIGTYFKKESRTL